MRISKLLYFSLTAICLFLAAGEAYSQAPIIINTSSGADSSWMTRDVPSVALGKKKFTLKRRLYQNLITRFNSYYNAHTKLSAVVDRAAASHQNNYDSLLTLFPYANEDFDGMKGNLDSVVYDASYGIEIHDPRSKWIDNLYLIAGEAFYYQRDYFNAVSAFKFIIKNKGTKDPEGAPAIIGTRGYTPQEQISIATPEKKKLFYHRPSRNDAYIWLIRTYIDSGNYDLARNLITTLKSDPAFPSRLHTDLLTMQAWFYFRQGQVAKGIPFVEQGVDSLDDKRLKARWEYLLGQYDQQRGDWGKAISRYTAVTHLRADPMMHFYAYLNMTEMHILQNKEDFRTGSLPLLAMARREKYEHFRSIIYYSLARMAVKFGLDDQAISYLRVGLVFNPENTTQVLRSSWLLADTYFATGNYRDARKYYDSTSLLLDPATPGYDQVVLRRDALGDVVARLDVIERQDSLQRLAAMPEDQLMALLTERVNDSLKAQKRRNLILREPAAGAKESGLAGRLNQQAGQDQGGTGAQGWYFYNPSLRAKGFSIFRSHWGKRPLSDNWRTGGSGRQPASAAVAQQQAAGDSSARGRPEAGTFDVKSLMAGLPLTPGQKKTSDDSIRNAMFEEAAIFYDKLENDTISLKILDSLLARFPSNPFQEALYFRLSLIYTHLGNTARADYYRNLLRQKFGGSKYAAALNGVPKDTTGPMERLTTQLYDSAYLDYLGGDYNRVLTLKDSTLRMDPTNKQKARFDLLGAMVLVKQQSDSLGKIALEEVMEKDETDTAIAAQAKAILNALNHKQELIEHLAHLQLPTEEENAAVATPAPRQEAAVAAKDTLKAPAPAVTAPPVAVQAPPAAPRKDTVRAAPPPPKTPYKLAPAEPHFVVLAFTHTDKRFIDQSLNSFSAYNQKNHLKEGIEVSSYLLGHNQVVLIFRLFASEAAALKYYQEIRKMAPESIIPGIPPPYYRFFIISRSNFILLNSSKDYEGYLNFFSQNYK